LERKTLDLSAKLGNFAIKRQATWGMSVQEFFKYNIQIESVPTILGVQASLNTIHRLATDFLHWVEQNTRAQTDIQKV
jgi:hypothetical protein